MDEKPLFPSKEAAYAAEGEIYQHYKGGETGAGPRRKAGAAWPRGGVAQNRSSDLCVTVSACAHEHLRSQIFVSPSLDKFRDPASRFRLLAKYRCGFEMSENAKQFAFSVSFRPHNHTLFFRPEEMFFGKNEKGEERFKLVKGV